MKRIVLTLLTGIGTLAAVNCATAADFATPDQISQAQQALRQEGYGTETSGSLNDSTVTALRAYQNVNGLPMTGTVDPQTAALLGLDGAAAAAQEQSAIRENVSYETPAREMSNDSPFDNNIGTGQANVNANGY